MKKITITGNVGRDPEVRANQNGEYFATFSVAVNVGTKDKPRTDWVDIVCNGKKVDFAKQYIKKGGKVLVEGFPSAYGYLQEGVVHAKLRISNPQIELLGKASHDEDSHTTEEIPADDIPNF